MRTISPAALALLSQRIGIEPVNVVAIQWISGGTVHLYSDRKDIGNDIEGKILELSNLESVIPLDKSGSSTSIKIKLDDTDGSIKEIYNNNDIHRRPVQVFQWFTNIPITEKFLIFEGGIASPIEWNEGDRTLSFDVLTKLEDREVGFSVEEGSFTGFPPELVGKPWPLIFGTVLNAATTLMDTIPSGTTAIPIGIPDHNLGQHIDFIDYTIGEQLAKASCLSLEGARLQTEGQISGGGRDIFEAGQALQRQADDIIRNVNREYKPDKDRFEIIKEDQDQYDARIIPIINGRFFHQGVPIILDINGAEYAGSFTGDNFIVSSRKSPDEPVHLDPVTKNRVEGFEVVIQDTQQENDQAIADAIFGGTFIPEGSDDNKSVRPRGSDPCGPPNYFYLPATPPPSTETPREGKFFFANAGTTVKPGGSYPIRHIVSIVPGTIVLAISARRTVGGLKVLVPVPSQYYSVGSINYGGIIAIVVTLNQPLSTIKNADWEDTIYASLQSPIGPNVVDILTYLIQTYTIFSIDTTSFSYVRTKVDNYPANFALYDRKNIITVLKDISFQSRCSIWVTNNKFYIKYLPEESAAVDTITESDIDVGTLQISCTETEDLTTKLIATWKADLSKDSNRVILRYNVNKYGINEKTFDFYIYNDVNLVIKSATFWLIRYANTWKKVKCRTPLHKLTMETSDSVLLDFDTNYLANVPITGIIEKATFDSSSLSIDFDIWTPVRLGEMLPYQFAYPANISADIIFPTEKDEAGQFAGGDGPGSQAGGDLTQPITITYEQGNPSDRHNDRGDPNPSDINDNYPITTTIDQYGNVGLGPGGTTGTGGTGSSMPQQPITPPSYDYKFKNYVTKEAIVNDLPASASLICKVESGSGDTYQVRLFPFGPDNDKEADTALVEAKMLQIHEDEEVPAGSWWWVIRISYLDKDKKTKIQYFMQFPIWL